MKDATYFLMQEKTIHSSQNLLISKFIYIARRKRSLSGGNDSTQPIEEDTQDNKQKIKGTNKRVRSTEKQSDVSDNKKNKLERERAVYVAEDTDGSSECENSNSSDSESDEGSIKNDNVASQQQEDRYKDMPDDTPEWGKWILRVMRNDFQTLSQQVKTAQDVGTGAKQSVDTLTQKIANMEIVNKKLTHDNLLLQEKVNELEYRQRRSNLVFEGASYSQGDTDDISFHKLQRILYKIFGKNLERSQIERCHWINSKNVHNKKVIICCFSWFGDVQKILKNRKLLPKGVFVNEDLPDEWLDRRKILKPIYNTAKHQDSLKAKTFFSKDKLIINGKAYTVGPESNLCELEGVIDVAKTCQRSDDSKTVFQGIHSVFSNLHPCEFVLDKTKYNCVEQAIQSTKAETFGDQTTYERVMNNSNPYKIKKLGSRVRNYDRDKWLSIMEHVVHRAVKAKFVQNPTLKNLLLNTGSAKIAEATMDNTWGVGVLLHDDDVLDETKWKQDGLMCKIYAEVREEVSKG